LDPSISQIDHDLCQAKICFPSVMKPDHEWYVYVSITSLTTIWWTTYLCSCK